MARYQLIVTIMLDEDSHLLDCLRWDDRRSSRVVMSDDAGDQIRDDLLVCGLDKIHYEMGDHETTWRLGELQD